MSKGQPAVAASQKFWKGTVFAPCPENSEDVVFCGALYISAHLLCEMKMCSEAHKTGQNTPLWVGSRTYTYVTIPSASFLGINKTLC